MCEVLCFIHFIHYIVLFTYTHICEVVDAIATDRRGT